MRTETEKKLPHTNAKEKNETQSRLKINCWEFKKCGREPGGVKEKELGVCPATTETGLHGTHGGKNAGRACWVVAGSMCGGNVQGTFAQKYGNCIKCDFFKEVKDKEGTGHISSAVLLKKLQDDKQSELSSAGQGHPHVQNNTEHKKVNIIDSIKHRTKLLSLIVVLTTFTLLFINVKVFFSVLNYIPSVSVGVMLSIVSGLVLITFYLSRIISLNAINKLIEEVNKRRTAEENLEKANEELEERVKERTSELSKAITYLKKSISRREQMEEKLYNLSITDELTGLYNRRGFFTLADHRLKLAKQQKTGLLLLYADLDNLKEVNDTFGHEEGDKLLKETGNILRSTYRTSDIIARIGGDEFVVFPIGKIEDEVEKLISRFQKNIDLYNAKSNSSYTLSISIGVSAYDPDSITTIDGLLAEADKLMYEHKMCKEGLD